MYINADRLVTRLSVICTVIYFYPWLDSACVRICHIFHYSQSHSVSHEQSSVCPYKTCMAWTKTGTRIFNQCETRTTTTFLFLHSYTYITFYFNIIYFTSGLHSATNMATRWSTLIYIHRSIFERISLNYSQAAKHLYMQ